MVKLNLENCFTNMKYQPRYAAFLKTGGGKNYEFMEFISKMKKLYGKSIGKHNDFSIYNHDEFTKFIERWVEENK